MMDWKAKFPQELQAKISKVEAKIAPKLAEMDEQALYNQQRVLELFRKHKVSEEDLVSSTGYGYDDIGREKLEKK